MMFSIEANIVHPYRFTIFGEIAYSSRYFVFVIYNYPMPILIDPEENETQALFDLYSRNLITEQECIQRAPDPKEIKRMIEGRDAFSDTGTVKTKQEKDFF